YDDAGHPVSTTTGGLMQQMAYDAAGRVTQLTNENSSHTVFTYDVLDRLVQETGFDGRTQRYQYSITGQLIRSEDESLVTLWHYDASDRLTHRTVNDEPAEQWTYNARGWLTEVSHLSDGHRVAVQYEYDKQGRLTNERQTVHNPETNELLWQHETRHDYSDKGLPDRVTPDTLPPVAWLTYGSGYLAGMKLGDTPLVEFTRDHLHRETQRRFGDYELTTAYTPGGQLQSHHLSIHQLNRDYTWNSGGQLVRISGQHEQRDYQYGDAGRLLGTHIQSPHHDLAQWTFTDPAGNRTAERDKYPMLPERFPDNRISQDVENFYHYDEHGRLTEKNERRIRPHGSVVHHYRYDNQHRLTHYRLMQAGNVLTESRYLYDPLGRRVSKRVWACTVYHDGSCSQPALQETVWYGQDGDKLTTTQTDKTRIQTVYQPGSFTPLIRIETATAELAKAARRTLAEKFQQEANVTFPPELVAMVDNLEAELQRGELSEASRAWLAQCGLTPAQIQNQTEPEYTPERKIHLYHCDHRGLPLALIDIKGQIAWRAEFDEWGNMPREDNPHNLEQFIRLPGQQYDKETGLYYNRHRYYDPAQGRYITQDPIGNAGGWNLYQYPLNPLSKIDPLGLSAWSDAKSGACTEGVCQLFSPFIGPEKFSDPDTAALEVLKKINGQSICEDKEFAGLICMDNKNNYFATGPNKGEEHESSPFDSPCPGSAVIATYHTHGAYSFGYADDFFSKRDVKLYEHNNILGYLGTPGGEFKKTDKSGREFFSKKELTTVCRIHAN
ncbi:RHS repeat protein, partial [Citrobacter amalonaticus]|nr:RHS repeat protein [Citrobacter amalonaticus]